MSILLIGGLSLLYLCTSNKSSVDWMETSFLPSPILASEV
jgi:hypothetical protein